MNQVFEAISQEKTPIYTEITAKHQLKKLLIPEVVIIKKSVSRLTDQVDRLTSIQEKNAEKVEQKSAYKEKQLILQTLKEFIENLNSMLVRDQINDAFFKKEGEVQPVIAMITKSQTNQLIIIITMPKFSAKYLVEKKEVWKSIVSHQRVYADEI